MPQTKGTDMNDDQKRAAYYLCAATQERTKARPEFVPCRVMLTRRISGDWPVGHDSQIGPGEFDCTANPYGAVSVIAENGKKLGLRLDEFTPIAWVANEEA
jgi:hypothetical protein